MHLDERPSADVTPGGDGFGAVLRNRQFVSLWSGQIISQLADKVFYLLMVVLVTTGSTAHSSISLLTIIYTLPAVFFGSVAGVFVDRWDKRTILILTNLGRAAAILLMPTSGPWLILGIYMVAFTVSTITQFFAPAEVAMLPALVERRQLLAANSLFTTTMITSIIIGFAVGEPLLTLFGNQWAHVAVAGLYVLSAACIFLVKRTPPTPVSETHFLRELREGLSYVWRHKPVLQAMLRLIILFSAFAAVSVLVIGFVRDALELAERYFGYILAVSGLGMAIGAGIVGRFGHTWNRQWLVFAGFLLMGWQLVIMSHVGTLAATMAVAVGVGIGAAFVAVPLQAFIQEVVPDSLRGKVFGVQNMAINTASTVPMALAGILGDAFGVRWVVFLTGILVLLGTLIGGTITSPKDPVEV